MAKFCGVLVIQTAISSKTEYPPTRKCRGCVGDIWEVDRGRPPYGTTLRVQTQAPSGRVVFLYVFLFVLRDVFFFSSVRAALCPEGNLRTPNILFLYFRKNLALSCLVEFRMFETESPIFSGKPRDACGGTNASPRRANNRRGFRPKPLTLRLNPKP